MQKTCIQITQLIQVFKDQIQFLLSFENENGRTSHPEFYLPNVEIKDCNVMIDGKNFFDQPINNNFKTYKNIRKMQQVDEMITQLVIHWIIPISKKIIK